MHITGTFKTLDNAHTIRVDIESAYNGTDIEIGDTNASDVCFGDDPVTISTESKDTFTHIISRSCEITLVSKIWLGDILFANKVTSVPVRVYKDDRCIYDGFVEHNAYSQGYDSNYNNITLHCVDYLGALETQKMTDLTDYETLKSNMQQRTVKQLFTTFFGSNVNIYYDGSKRVYDASNNLSYYWTQYLSILDNVWLGDSEDDVWDNKTIVNEILKYMNLHIIQLYDFKQATKTRAFYIFDWDYTQRYSTQEEEYARFRYNLTSNTYLSSGMDIELKTLGLNDYTKDDTNFSIDNVYNQISVKEKANDLKNVITNPLDTDDLESPYTQYNRYMTEFIGIGQGKKAKRTLKRMVKGVEDFTWKDSEGFYRHWYIRYLHNENWIFKSFQFDTNTLADTSEITDIRETTDLIKDQALAGGTATIYDTSESILNVVDQWSLLKAAWYKGGNMQDLPNGSQGYQTGAMIYPNDDDSEDWYNILDPVRLPNCIGATMFNIWSTGKITTEDSSTPQKKENNKNWICITVGNRYNDRAQEALYATNDGVCKFTSTSAANLVPVTDDVAYHLVFTGTIVLSPFINMVWNYYKTKTYDEDDLPSATYDEDVTCNFKYGNDDGCVYSRVFYDTTQNTGNYGDEYNQAIWKEPEGLNYYSGNIVPWISDDGLKRYQYKSDSEHRDTIYKVGVLLCRLKIGDKYLSEGYETQVSNGVEYSYPNNTFTWTTDPTATFTMGFDPKINDYLIGQEYKLGTNISAFTNIDSEYGIDIPIHKSDNVTGPVEFTIIGPCPIGWADNHKRHRTFFRHSKYWTDLVENIFYNTELSTYDREADGPTTPSDDHRVASYSRGIDNIFVGELKCNLYCDAGGYSFLKENDIIYMSDESDTYVEKKSIEFKLVSGFTTAEMTEFGTVIGAVKNNVYNANNAPNLTIYPVISYTDDNGSIYKPEKLYVKQYYDEYKEIKLLVETDIKYTDEEMFFRRYVMNFFSGKMFYPLSIDTNLKFQTSKIKMKER